MEGVPFLLLAALVYDTFGGDVLLIGLARDSFVRSSIPVESLWAV
jgi:hypothetical protein